MAPARRRLLVPGRRLGLRPPPCRCGARRRAIPVPSVAPAADAPLPPATLAVEDSVAAIDRRVPPPRGLDGPAAKVDSPRRDIVVDRRDGLEARSSRSGPPLLRGLAQLPRRSRSAEFLTRETPVRPPLRGAGPLKHSRGQPPARHPPRDPQGGSATAAKGDPPQAGGEAVARRTNRCCGRTWRSRSGSGGGGRSRSGNGPSTSQGGGSQRR